MKKILMLVLIVLLLILCVVAATKGLPFGIPSIGNIINNNKEIDDAILQATTIASTDYDNIKKEVDSDIKKLEEEKKKYDELVSVSTGSEVQAANQYQKYEIEYLWTIIGNHAKKEGVVIKMDLSAGTGDNVYNLNFTVNGAYIGISDFIADIENDSALGFKIENFYLIPSSSTDTLKATFVCKDITIRDVANSVKATNDKQTSEKQTTSNNTTDETNKSSSSSDSKDSKETESTSEKTSNDSSSKEDKTSEDELQKELTKLDRE